MQSQYRALHYSASRGKNESTDDVFVLCGLSVLQFLITLSLLSVVSDAEWLGFLFFPLINSIILSVDIFDL